jgi:3-hydroxymyristoyl/3-hydroxydecanoyl-(acyl carrier protein) dehydratase
MPFSIAHDHPCLPGHFPGRPVVPGVVLLEHVIEAIESAHGPVGPIRLPQVKFLRPLLPGQVAEIELAPAATGRWRFRVLHAGELVASGDVARGEAG